MKEFTNAFKTLFKEIFSVPWLSPCLAILGLSCFIIPLFRGLLLLFSDMFGVSSGSNREYRKHPLQDIACQNVCLNDRTNIIPESSFCASSFCDEHDGEYWGLNEFED